MAVLAKDAPPEKKPRILAVIDSVVANPACYMPWREMVAICHEEGVMSLVDAAHSLGQEQNINLSATKPDFWISVSAPLTDGDTNVNSG